MTLLTLGSEAPGVYVVSGMTRPADHRRLDGVLRPDVAVSATHFRVCAQQGETGVSGMIEVPHLPAVGRVAIAAVLTQSAIVDIVLHMTADTFLWRIVESLRRMALPAGHDDMQSRERILRLVVVEIHVFPFGRVVALLALLTQRPAMSIIGAVAVDALGAQLLIFHNAGMTHVAVEF